MQQLADYQQAQAQQQQILALQAESIAAAQATQAFDVTQIRRDLALDDVRAVLQDGRWDDAYVPPVAPVYGYDNDPATTYTLAERDLQFQQGIDLAANSFAEQHAEAERQEAWRRAQDAQDQALAALQAEATRQGSHDSQTFLASQSDTIDQAGQRFFDDMMRSQSEAVEADMRRAMEQHEAAILAQREDAERLYQSELANCHVAAEQDYQRIQADTLAAEIARTEDEVRRFNDEQQAAMLADTRAMSDSLAADADRTASERAAQDIADLRQSLQNQAEESAREQAARWSADERRNAEDVARSLGTGAEARHFDGAVHAVADEARAAHLDHAREEAEHARQAEVRASLQQSEEATTLQLREFMDAELRQMGAAEQQRHREETDRIDSELIRLQQAQETLRIQADEVERLSHSPAHADELRADIERQRLDSERESLALEQRREAAEAEHAHRLDALEEQARDHTEQERLRLEAEGRRLADEEGRRVFDQHMLKAADNADVVAQDAVRDAQDRLRAEAEVHGGEVQREHLMHWEEQHAAGLAEHAASLARSAREAAELELANQAERLREKLLHEEHERSRATLAEWQHQRAQDVQAAVGAETERLRSEAAEAAQAAADEARSAALEHGARTAQERFARTSEELSARLAGLNEEIQARGQETLRSVQSAAGQGTQRLTNAARSLAEELAGRLRSPDLGSVRALAREVLGAGYQAYVENAAQNISDLARRYREEALAEALQRRAEALLGPLTDPSAMISAAAAAIRGRGDEPDNAQPSTTNADVSGTSPADALSRGRHAKLPGFEPLRTADRAIAKSQIAELNAALGISIPPDRALVAPWFGSTDASTSEGWRRDGRGFLRDYLKHFPEDAGLLDKERVVTPKLAAAWGMEGYVGDRLVHHHLNNGPLVVLLPESLHERENARIHRTPKRLG
jgi:hypothetical protein